jgi:hypothetical protein
MTKKNAKGKPSLQAAPSRKEQPVPLRPEGTGDMPPGAKPVWRLSSLDLDHNGSWSWNLSTASTLREIAEFLAQMENLTWAELKALTSPGKGGNHKRNKAIPVEQLCPDAQKRLRELKLDHLDGLFEFRIRSKPRLWGYARQGVFHVVWWDPEHKVYPVEPS